MDELRRRLVQGWLVKAQNDLAKARKLAEHPTSLLDTAIYHCQQAEEIAVKGLLSFHERPILKTHAESCSQHPPAFPCQAIVTITGQGPRARTQPAPRRRSPQR